MPSFAVAIEACQWLYGRPDTERPLTRRCMSTHTHSPREGSFLNGGGVRDPHGVRSARYMKETKGERGQDRIRALSFTEREKHPAPELNTERRWKGGGCSGGERQGPLCYWREEKRRKGEVPGRTESNSAEGLALAYFANSACSAAISTCVLSTLSAASTALVSSALCLASFAASSVSRAVIRLSKLELVLQNPG
ncbi:hypothetical protein BC628DRAFT_445557 [Trametes gibbosa]|nr:hypothetical protein BC628DRAFT_445557 [Trametes gibbosa]